MQIEHTTSDNHLQDPTQDRLLRKVPEARPVNYINGLQTDPAVCPHCRCQTCNTNKQLPEGMMTAAPHKPVGRVVLEEEARGPAPQRHPACDVAGALTAAGAPPLLRPWAWPSAGPSQPVRLQLAAAPPRATLPGKDCVMARQKGCSCWATAPPQGERHSKGKGQQSSSTSSSLVAMNFCPLR